VLEVYYPVAVGCDLWDLELGSLDLGERPDVVGFKHKLQAKSSQMQVGATAKPPASRAVLRLRRQIISRVAEPVLGNRESIASWGLNGQLRWYDWHLISNY
jgi:hypothetical protein